MTKKTDTHAATATTNRPTFEIPTSITIVNESTPLIQKYGKSTNSIRSSLSTNQQHPDYYKVLSLSNDPSIFKKEVHGLLLLGLSALAFTFSALFVKQCGNKLPIFEIVFARSSIQLVLALASCVLLRVNPFGNKSGVCLWLFVRGFVGSLGLILFFYSLTKLSLFEATVMFFLGPAFTTVLVAILFNDTFTVFDGFCSILCTAGVLLISQPRHLFGRRDDDNSSKDMQRTFAIVCALTGAFMSAAAYVAVRKVGKRVHFMTHVFYVGFIATIMSLVGLFAFQEFILPQEHLLVDWIHLALVGLLAFIGQCLLNQGLKLAPAGPGTLMRMSEVLSAYAVGGIFLHEYPDLYTVLGAALIVGMTTALGIHRWQIVTARKAAAIQRRQSRERIRSHSSSSGTEPHHVH
ncbi:hypothetical protein BDA99DRAFT_520113 [Phascolomyces articulosus]|uniref:EamA domain-containing protein n=1 Tax=Phascolomyces articulosus TaxID=60185 RepID=A0AAD5JSP9_9FUNG|nr:hypothetical protein BDA99DRAFT_520113 [Phascolomyces articulosus]